MINNDFSQIILRQAQAGCTLHKPRGPFTWTLAWMMSLGVTQCRMALHSGQISHDASQHSSLLGKSNIAGLLNLLTTPYDLTSIRHPVLEINNSFSQTSYKLLNNPKKWVFPFLGERQIDRDFKITELINVFEGRDSEFESRYPAA